MEPKCTSCMKRERNEAYTYNENLFSLRKEENLTLCDNWINLEDIRLREIRQSQKVNYCMILLTRGI